MSDLLDYYARRAGEYEAIYRKPERQADLAMLKRRVADLCRDHDVLELACGTGYWTETIALTARSVLATDAAAEVLDAARAKSWPADGRFRFEAADAWNVEAIPGNFTAIFCGFFWSHVEKDRWPDFLTGLAARQAHILLIDNVFVPGSSTPIHRTDSAGNTYQERKLRNGDRYEVLKNFPDPSELKDLAARFVGLVEVETLEYYWLLSFRAGPRPSPANSGSLRDPES